MKTKLLIQGNFIEVRLFAFLFSLCILLPAVSSAQVISAGSYHSLAVCSDSTVRSWGWNNNGQLGVGTTTSSSTPVQVNSLTGIIAMDGGGVPPFMGNSSSHSVFLKNDGTVWACGKNNYGQLGDSTTTPSSTPVQVNSLSGIIAVACGFFHSLFIKNDSTVWACGRNFIGQLGDGTTTNRSTPVQVSGLTSITSVASGGNHSLFLKNDGTVWACGQNLYGALGVGDTIDRLTPVQVNSLTSIIAVAGGGSHSLFLKNDGTVWACGSNYLGQLGDSTTTDRSTPVQVNSLTGIIAVASGGSHSLFLKNDGTVWACGLNTSGQLGDGTTTSSSTPVQVNSLTGITAMAAGYLYSLFLKNDETVWACGRNVEGQLGNGTSDNNPHPTPLQVTGLCPMITAITEPKQEDGFQIYPNPTTGQFTINLGSNNRKVVVTITDLTGKIIYTTTASDPDSYREQKIEVNIQDFATGIYVVQIQTADFMGTKKLVVEK
ncbi:MAG: T9SS type A sorting domain-containing protein [Bacteroidetes bacterium]|nr:T9SS type A sorting domain-containing protein [Bacteroidota bacterium]